jgi:hypothetical protein
MDDVLGGGGGGCNFLSIFVDENNGFIHNRWHSWMMDDDDDRV